MKNFIFLFITFLSLSIYSQYTEVINSKRPGLSESPFGIGTKVFQFESGFFYQYNDRPNLFTKQQSIGIDLFLRSGLVWEKLEVNANFKYQKDKVLDNIVLGTTYPINGISQFTVGAKYLFYMPKYKNPDDEIRSWKAKMAFDKRRLIPSVGLYAGLNTNFLGKDYKAPSLSPKAVILLQNDFSERLIWVNNIVGDYLTLNEQRTIGYISTLSYSITDRFSMFGETQGMFTRYTKEFEYGGGFAYLPTKNLQIGVFVHSELQFDYLNLYGGLGLSWRMDKHKDKVIYKKGQNTEGSGKPQAKGSFFSRVFKKKGRRSKPPKAKKTHKKRGRKNEKSEKSRRSRRSRRSKE
jgi:hypothetical protein